MKILRFLQLLISHRDFVSFSRSQEKHSFMKAKMILFIVFAFCAARAQDTLSMKPKIALGFQIAPSMRLLTNNNGLNTALKDARLPTLKKQIFFSEIGMGIMVNRFYVSLLARAYSPDPQTKGEYIIHGKGIGGEFRLHYNLLKSDRFFFGPNLGFSGDAYDFKFDNANQRTLGNALSSPGTNPPVKVSIEDQLSLVGGVTFLTRTRNKSKHFETASGIQLGYSYSTQNNYRVNDELVRGPKSSFSGIDAKVILLFNLNFSGQR
jgi:hypothetical protein